MNLAFSPSRPVQHAGETYYVRHAIATQEFWKKWRFNKETFTNMGISVIKEKDDGGRAFWRVKQVMRRMPHGIPEPVKTAPVVLSDTSKLLDYQIPAVSCLMGSLISNRVAIDASDTGTGKTYTSLKTAILSGYQPAIVCNKTGIYDWRKVCDFMRVIPAFICNWESSIGRIYRKNGRIIKTTQPPNKFLQMKVNPYTARPTYYWNMASHRKIVFIFDEVHKANGKDTHNQAIVRAAASQGFSIIALSATFADKMAKLRTLGSITGLFHWDGFEDWLREQGCFMNSHGAWESLTEREMMREVNKYIFPNFGVRIKKADVKGFPDVQNIARLYEIPKKEILNKKYSDLMQKIEKLKQTKETAKILVLQLRYRQLAEMNKVSLFCDLVNEYKEAGHSVVLFTNFRDTLERVSKRLKTTCTIYGGQKEDVRRKNINDFQADKERVIICNMQAGAVNISLHDLNGDFPRIAIISPTWDAKLLTQAMGRVHRAGAKSKAINLLAYAAGTVEEKVYTSVCGKIQNINSLNDGDLAEMEIFQDG